MSRPPKTPETLPAVYSRLLGAAWDSLPTSVRHLHEPATASVRTGTFAVQRGASIVARVVGRILHLPHASDAVPITLEITPTPSGVMWRRTFDRVELRSVQEVQGDRLVERMGGFEYRFRLEARDRVLVFHLARTALCVGPLRIRLPAFLGPRIASTARAVSPTRVRTEVTIALPLTGLLLAYTGEFDAGDV